MSTFLFLHPPPCHTLSLSCHSLTPLSASSPLSASILPPHLPRLSVRNLPTSIDEKQLRRVFLDGAGGRLASIKQVVDYPAMHDVWVCVHVHACIHVCMGHKLHIMCYVYARIASHPYQCTSCKAHNTRVRTCLFTAFIESKKPTHFAG